MKKLSSICKLLFIILTIISCEEDGSEKIEYPPLEKFNYRIVSAIEYNGQEIIGKSVFQYNGDSLIYFSDSSTYASNECELEYPGDNKILMDYFLYSDHSGLTWRSYTITISDNRIKEVIYDNIKHLYSYNSSGQILKKKVYHYEDSWKLNYTMSYSYSSNNLIKWLFELSDGSDDMKGEFSYNGNEIEEMIQYQKNDGIWQKYIKQVYSYTSGKITRIDKYEYYNDNWNFDGSLEYSYDNNGNLIKRNNVVYTYEEGSGNYRQIMFILNTLSYLEPIPY